LTKLRTARKKNIDLVYVSHIDQDHIGGVLRMLDDEVLWRVHDHQRKNGNPGHKPPKAPRPPAISALWHNAFHEQLRKNAGPIEEALAASAPVLSGAQLQELRDVGMQQAGLVTSIREAIRVSRRVGLKQLDIVLNAVATGRSRTAASKLLMSRPGQPPIALGQFRITILGPTESHLKKMRAKWNEWLRVQKNKKIVNDLRTTARADEKRLGASDLDRLLAVMTLQAEAFGDPGSVTPPNLASLTLLVEEGGKSILLTGDARWDQIIDGLEKAGKVQSGQSMAVDVVKVPHHGSENNVVETTLLDRVVGTDYVFCGNGHSGNPEIDVIELMVKHRLKARGKFKFWFNSSAAVATEARLRNHMRKVERLVRTLAGGSGGRMTFKFLTTGSSLRVI
jgi:hypothetical protein